MMYWLKSTAKREAYDEASAADKKVFALEWFAWSLKEGSSDKTAKRKIGHEKTKKEVGRWWSKHKIIDMFGEQKAKARIEAYDKDPKKHRPDRETGLDGEWHREYYILEDEDEDKDFDGTEHELATKKEIKSDQDKDEALEDMMAFGLCGRAGTSVGGATSSKSAEPAGVKVKVEGQMPDESMKTFESIKAKPKQVLRSVSDAVTEMKRMFEVCNDDGHRKRYTEPLQGDITKLLPKLKTDFVNVEKILLSLNRSKPMPDTEILACARKLDTHFTEMNEISDWFGKLCPKKKGDKDIKGDKDSNA
jgi:hypothetical protein